MLTFSAPAKLNLGLYVLRRRSDGYHDLDTVFMPIAWHDVLKIDPAPTLVLSCSDARLPVDESNLVLQAALALQQETGVENGALLYLDKHVPFGAGLGGGSSDAATTLRALCTLWGVEVSETRLHALATALGSDVPFFLNPVPSRATGRGEVLTPLVTASGAPFQLSYPIVVVAPGVLVSTAEAYKLVTPQDEGRADLAEVVLSGDLDLWRTALVNDFEAPVCATYPALTALRQALWDAGAAYVSLSGSGSAFYGVFREDRMAYAAAEALRYEGYQVWHGVA